MLWVVIYITIPTKCVVILCWYITIYTSQYKYLIITGVPLGRQTCSVSRPRRDIFDKYIDTLADTDILRLDDRYRCSVANKGVAEQENKRTSEQGVPHVPNVPFVPGVPFVPFVPGVPDVD